MKAMLGFVLLAVAVVLFLLAAIGGPGFLALGLAAFAGAFLADRVIR